MTTDDGKERERRELNKKARERIVLQYKFAKTSVIVGGATAALSILANILQEPAVKLLYSQDNLRALAILITKTHWLIFLSSAIMIYAGISYFYAKHTSNGNGPLNALFSVPSWVELQCFGDQHIFKISYFAIVIIPLIVALITENPLNLELVSRITIPLNLKISFFLSFFLSIALIIFVIGCPKEFKRVRTFESAKNVNMVFGTADSSHIQVAQDEGDFYDEELDASKLELRALCWLFYLLGLSFSVVLLFRAARFVLYA